MKNRVVKREFAELALNSSASAFTRRLKDATDRKNFMLTVIHEGGTLADREITDRLRFNEDIPITDFDAYSYTIFRLGLSYVRNPHERITVLDEVGEAIFRHIAEMSAASRSQNIDEIIQLKCGMGGLLDYFISMNYIAAGMVHLNRFQLGGCKWSGFDVQRWEELGIGEFVYEMSSPAKLPGAWRLEEEFGLSQHYSSRTLRAFLRSCGIDGMPDNLFGQEGLSSNVMVEHWTIKRMKHK